MEFKVWIIYLLTEFLLSITPGPAVMLVSTQGFKYGAKPSYFGSLGISSGNLMYFILSALGLGTLILAAGDLFEYVKIGGAIYLICTGILMYYKSFKTSPIENTVIIASQNNIKSYIQGFVTQAANPKAIIFFVALLPQFIDKTKDITIQFTILALTTIIMETFILIFYGWIAAAGKRKIAQNNKIIKWQDRVAGSILIGLGINLILIKTKIK
jgi:homoserine/homoserine lactone efflux protein